MFCRFCGKQVLDEAYMCPSCGCMIRPLPQTVAPVTVEAPASKEPSKAHKVLHRLSKNFTKVGVILNAIGFAFMILSIIFMIIGLVGAEEYGYLSQLSSSTMEELNYAEEMMATGMIFWYVFGLYGLIVVAVSSELSTVGFVFSLIQKVDPSIKKKSIPVFAVSVVLLYVLAYVTIFGAYMFILFTGFNY